MGGAGRWWGRMGPPITGILFINLPNSRLLNQKDENTVTGKNAD